MKQKKKIYPRCRLRISCQLCKHSLVDRTYVIEGSLFVDYECINPKYRNKIK